MRKLFLIIILFFTTTMSWAQCAMCRATVENSISKGHVQFAASLNTGILYLFFTPYVLAGVIAFFWFRISKQNAAKNKIRIHAQKQD